LFDKEGFVNTSRPVCDPDAGMNIPARITGYQAVS
jgi:hypothetical protein